MGRAHRQGSIRAIGVSDADTRLWRGLIVVCCLHSLRSWLWSWNRPTLISHLSMFVFNCPLRDLIWGWAVFPHNSDMEERPAAEKKLVPLSALKRSIISHRGIYYVSLTAVCPLLLQPKGTLCPAWDSLYWTYSWMPSWLFPTWLLMNIFYAWFDDCMSYIPVVALKHHDL